MVITWLWMVYQGKSQSKMWFKGENPFYKWMISGYPHFRKPPLTATPRWLDCPWLPQCPGDRPLLFHWVLMFFMKIAMKMMEKAHIRTKLYIYNIYYIIYTQFLVWFKSLQRLHIQLQSSFAPADFLQGYTPGFQDITRMKSGFNFSTSASFPQCSTL